MKDEQNISKTCKACNSSKPLDDFYNAGVNKQTLCKPCHNKTRKHYKNNYIKKCTKFQALPEYVQKIIIDDLKDGKTLAKITKEINLLSEVSINYQTLGRWKRSGLIK